jgi:hypothetical protein
MKKKMIQSLEDSTPDSCFDLLHPDYIFVRHQSGEEVFKEDWKPNVTGMFNAMKEGNLTWSDNRYLYENDDIMVHHNIGSFPDGTKEAIMVVHTLKDDKIIRTETGSTIIK